MEAVFEHLVAEGLAIVDAEVEVLEKIGDAGEEAEALYAACFGLTHELLNELTTGSASFDIGTDDDGADLGEVRAIDVEGCTTEELRGVGFNDGEGANVGADFGVGAGKEGAAVREAVDQLMDGVRVLQLRFARPEEDVFEVSAEGGGAVLRWSGWSLRCWGDGELGAWRF